MFARGQYIHATVNAGTILKARMGSIADTGAGSLNTLHIAQYHEVFIQPYGVAVFAVPVLFVTEFNTGNGLGSLNMMDAVLSTGELLLAAVLAVLIAII
jgi:hypothetical protein